MTKKIPKNKKSGRKGMSIVFGGTAIVLVMSIFFFAQQPTFFFSKVAPIPTDPPIVVPEGGGHKEYEEPNSQENHVLVTIEKGKFIPETVTVKAGSTIVFENEETTEHSVVSDNYGSGDTATFDTGTLSYEKRVDAVTYEKPGTYTYHCTLHPEMKGTIIVTE